MLKKLLFGAGAAYLARKYIGGRGNRGDYGRDGGSRSWFGGSRSGRRGLDL